MAKMIILTIALPAKRLKGIIPDHIMKLQGIYPSDIFTDSSEETEGMFPDFTISLTRKKPSLEKTDFIYKLIFTDRIILVARKDFQT